MHAANLDDETPHALLKGVCVNAAPLDEAPEQARQARQLVDPELQRGEVEAVAVGAAVAMLVGPNAALELEPRRASHMINRWDFYKPAGWPDGHA